MRFGLEVWCSLLDYWVRRFGVEFLMDLWICRGLKTVLRDQLVCRVFCVLFECFKMGFGVLLVCWLVGLLVERIVDSLGVQVFCECGWLD